MKDGNVIVIEGWIRVIVYGDSSSSSRFYYFTRGVPAGCAFLLGTLGDVL